MIEYKFEAYSIVGITILIAGLLRLYIYYKSFGISILPFLEPGEILTIFFDNLLYFLFFVTLNLIVIGLLYSIELDLSAFPTDISLLKRLEIVGFFKWNKLALFVLLTLVMIIISWKRDSKNFYEVYLWMGLLIVAIYINPLAYFESKYFILNGNLPVNKISIAFLISSINLFIFSSVSGLNESFKVKRKNYYKGSEFELDSKQSIISTMDYYYIGKTKQFAFFYDRKNQKTDVIPVSRITKMKFKK